MTQQQIHERGYRFDLIRVGLARTFSLEIVRDPIAECRARGVSEERMIEQATEFDLYGRSLKQLNLL